MEDKMNRYIIISQDSIYTLFLTNGQYDLLQLLNPETQIIQNGNIR